VKLIRKIVRSLNSRGLGGTLLWFIFGYFSINKFIVFYLNLEKPFEPSQPGPSVKISKISIDTLNLIRAGAKDLPIEFYCDETHGFTIPYVAEVDGEIAAIHWLVKPGEKSRFLELGAGDLEMNFNTVLPKFRDKRLAELLMAKLISSCSGGDFKRMFGVVHVSNVPQYKQMIRLGFEPVEVVTHFGMYRPKATLRYV